MKRARTHKSLKKDPVLISLAESIGSTLGSLAAKADAAQRALTNGRVTAKAQREGRKLVRKSKKTARAARRSLRHTPVKGRRRGRIAK